MDKTKSMVCFYVFWGIFSKVQTKNVELQEKVVYIGIVRRYVWSAIFVGG